nr:hypothetical protein [uncultured bacterium]
MKIFFFASSFDLVVLKNMSKMTNIFIKNLKIFYVYNIITFKSTNFMVWFK